MSRSEPPAPDHPGDGRRFPLLTDATMTPRQRESYQAIVSGPRQGARGPFNALLRSPEVADRVQKVGEYIRFQSSIPAPLNEMAILITGRFWGAQYEYWAHSRLARTAGLGEAIIDAIAQGRRPSVMSDEERAVYDFCTELFRDRAVSDAAFGAAVARFGEQGVIDLIAASGYYSLVSMVLNVDRHPLPAGERPPLQALSSEARR
jgi:4-carboxymuconolactone decarboxylase